MADGQMTLLSRLLKISFDFVTGIGCDLAPLAEDMNTIEPSSQRRREGELQSVVNW